MPPVRRSSNGSNGVPQGEVTPEELARIKASVTGKEQAPSTRDQASFVDWRQAADQLGQPFNVDKIPISKLRAMRRDPMLGFGLAFIKTPIVRAKWYINAGSNKGANAQIAAHLDHDLRRVYPSLVLTNMNKLDFGFQATVKRFELRTPAATYTEIDPETGEATQKPVWSEGSVQPIAWKPFVGLPPELVEPIWATDGSFDGIRMFLGDTAAPGGVSGTTSGSGGEKKLEIDVYHALWSTNEREANFGSIYGYPRMGYAYRYWWSYWFRWAIADRAFEKRADPSIVIRHPSGEYVNERTGEVLDYRDYALMIGDRLRSGSSVALPSDVYVGDIDGKPSTVPLWDIDFLKDGTNFDPFDKSFDYLDIQKLRSLFIPEQAFLEGKGGTSSRNVASEQGDNFTEQQSLLAQQEVETVNRWVIPQWLANNYPEFVADGGQAEMVMQGFADADIEFSRQIIQLIGQQESGAREIQKKVDLDRLLENAGTPISSFEEQQRKQLEIEAEAVASQPPAVDPTAGSVGVIPSATGFSYINPREVIYLSDSANDFADKLPATVHYADRAVRTAARQLWSEYRALYRDEYETLITALAEGDDELAMSDEGVMLATRDEFIEKATKIVSSLPGSGLWRGALERSQATFDRIAQRAAAIEAKRARVNASLPADEWEAWQKDHIATTASKVSETTRMEMRDFIAAQLAEGVTDRKQIAQAAREHFMEFPDWKADRLVRTEVRDAYNVATIFTAKAGDADVQAIDGQGENADEDCKARDGQIFAPDEAMDEDEHPNGTLGFRIVPLELSIERSDEVDGAEFDDETYTLTFSDDMEPEAQNRVLKSVIDHMYVMPKKRVAS